MILCPRRAAVLARKCHVPLVGGAGAAVDGEAADITARARVGSIVAIEIKTGTARQKAVGQILSYMGDLASEEPGSSQPRHPPAPAPPRPTTRGL